MPFLKAGFSARNRDTGIRGWTRHVTGRTFAPAELRRFACGDLFWLGERMVKGEMRSFLVWGDEVVIGSRPEFSLPMEWQHGLPQSVIPSPERRPRPVKLRLPYPVSANRYWISFYAPRAKRVFTGVTKEAEAFKEECGWLAKAAGVRVPFSGLVELHLRLIPENRVCMDLDNAMKVSIDALKGIVYEDDSQIYRIVAERGDADPTGKRLEVEVLPYLMPMALEAAA